MEVWCGMIMGFDSDDETIFDRQIAFVQEARIPFSMSGMLTAIPKTPLYARLARDGRLDPADTSEWGTNVIPLRMSREALREGFLRVTSEVYDPENYFRRTEALMLGSKLRVSRARTRYWEKRPVERFRTEALFRLQAVGFFWRLMRGVPDRRLRAEYRRRLWRYFRHCRKPSMILNYLFHLALQYHTYTLAQRMISGQTLVNSY